MMRFFAPKTPVGLALLTTASIITQSMFVVGLEERRKKQKAALALEQTESNSKNKIKVSSPPPPMARR